MTPAFGTMDNCSESSYSKNERDIASIKDWGIETLFRDIKDYQFGINAGFKKFQTHLA